jgi:hypothetical protein
MEREEEKMSDEAKALLFEGIVEIIFVIVSMF